MTGFELLISGVQLRHNHCPRFFVQIFSKIYRESKCKQSKGAVVVAQLVEQSLPIPEVRGLNPVIGKNLFIYIEHLLTVNCVLERRK